MSQEPNVVVIADTNAAYKLFFFSEQSVVPRINIVLEDIGRIEFHPVVWLEIEQHFTALRLLREYDHAGDGVIPNCIKHFNDEQLLRLKDFVQKNICANVLEFTEDHEDFQRSRRVYEQERLALQKKWKAEGSQAKKVRSKPSFPDYSILFTAEKKSFKILTNDEVLLAIAEQILDEGSTYKAEDIISAVLRRDRSKNEPIQKALENLIIVGETIITARIFRDYYRENS